MNTTEQNPDHIGYRDVLAMYGWNDAQFSQARTYGFPASIGSVFSRRGQVLDTLFSRRRIEDWQKDFLKLANHVERATSASAS